VFVQALPALTHEMVMPGAEGADGGGGVAAFFAPQCWEPLNILASIRVDWASICIKWPFYFRKGNRFTEVSKFFVSIENRNQSAAFNLSTSLATPHMKLDFVLAIPASR